MPHAIMSYETWVEQTKRGILKPRSKELRLVDAALKSYHKSGNRDSFEALSTALESWLVKKGSSWRLNDRNRNRAVEQLRAQIHQTDVDPRADETMRLLAELPYFGVEMRADEEARQFIRDHRRSFIVTLFSGKQLETRSAVRVQESREATKSIADVSRGGVTIAKAAGAPTSEAQKLIRSIVEDAFPDTDVESAIAWISQQVLPGFVAQFAAAATPYVGIATAGGKTVYGLGNAITAHWRAYTVLGHRQAILAGDPTAAADAIYRMILRERTENTRNAAINAVSLTARTLLLAIPVADAVGGPVIGGATAFANLVHQIYLCGRDWTEKSRANAILMNPKKIDLKVFDVCPVLGCYLVLCADDANVVNLLVEDFGWPGWQDSVLRMIERHVRPLREQAQRLVHESRYQIPSLHGFAHVRKPPSKVDKLTERLKNLESLKSITEDVWASLA